MAAADIIAELDSVSNAYSLAKKYQQELIEQITNLGVVNEQLRDSFEAVRDKLRELAGCESDEFIAKAIRSEWGK